MAKYFVLILFLFSGANQAYASCAGPFTLEEYRDMADLVVLGKAADADDPARVNVEKYFKGSGPREIKVSGRAGPAPGLWGGAGDGRSITSSIDFSFEEGKRYLLFLQNESGGIYKTNQCKGNRIVENDLSSEEQGVLGSGQEPLGEDSPGKVSPSWQMAGLAALILLVVLTFWQRSARMDLR